jgi:hypothetical protein
MRLAVLPLALVLIAAPGSAQIVINGSHQASASQRDGPVPMQRQGWSGELDRIHHDTSEAREDGLISRREARAIHRDEQMIRSLGSTYAAGGLTDAEIAVLESQAYALRDLSRAPNRPVPQRRGR